MLKHFEILNKIFKKSTDLPEITHEASMNKGKVENFITFSPQSFRAR